MAWHLVGDAKGGIVKSLSIVILWAIVFAFRWTPDFKTLLMLLSACAVTCLIYMMDQEKL